MVEWLNAVLAYMLDVSEAVTNGHSMNASKGLKEKETVGVVLDRAPRSALGDICGKYHEVVMTRRRHSMGHSSLMRSSAVFSVRWWPFLVSMSLSWHHVSQ